MEESVRFSNNETRSKQSQSPVSLSSSKFIGKVFLYTAGALLISAIVAAVIGIIFSTAITPNYDYSVITLDAEKMKPYIGLLIGSLIAYFPLIIWINVVSFRGKGNMVVPFVLYAIVMGVLISSFTMFVPIPVIAISFGITCVVFGLLSLIGLTAKKDISFLGLVASGILGGALLVALFNLIWSLVFPGSFQMLYWLVSYAIFFAMMLITIVDVYRIKRIAQAGEGSNNIALYCAFNLYVDFIYMFLRILLIVARIFGKSR